MGEVSGIFPSSGRESHGLGPLLLKIGKNVKRKLTGIQKLSLDPGNPRLCPRGIRQLPNNLSALGALSPSLSCLGARVLPSTSHINKYIPSSHDSQPPQRRVPYQELAHIHTQPIQIMLTTPPKTASLLDSDMLGSSTSYLSGIALTVAT